MVSGLSFFKTLMLVSVIWSLVFETSANFKENQLRYPRVKKAYETKYSKLKEALIFQQINPDNFEIFLRVFKQEKELEVWVKNKEESIFKLFKKYPICASSGELGPKRTQGDGQVPEGFYEIEGFNPASLYHLSMKVNYPNSADKIKAKGKPGGDIMIHGECVTIGCVPIENNPVEELYVLSVEAKNRGQKIKVHFFPFRFESFTYKESGKYDQELVSFWDNIKAGYMYFEKKHIIPSVKTDKNGNYLITE